MNILSRTIAAAFACLFSMGVLAQAPAAAADEGLVAVKSRKLDRAWLLPGADFRPFKKVLLRRAEVSFRSNWLRDVNGSSIHRTADRVTQEDALRIIDAARAGFDQVWAQAFKSAGYEVVSTPGDDVLDVAPRVVNLYVNAPDVKSSSISSTYTVQSGDATLQMELRDSRKGTLLARVSDKRDAGLGMQVQSSSNVTNRAEFEQLFATWAGIAVNGLKELKAASPLPETLKPGQKVPASK
jgi:Protein of unknown function (DUF3313)